MFLWIVMTIQSRREYWEVVIFKTIRKLYTFYQTIQVNCYL